jgi:hypothetical protein
MNDIIALASFFPRWRDLILFIRYKLKIHFPQVNPF